MTRSYINITQTHIGMTPSHIVMAITHINIPSGHFIMARCPVNMPQTHIIISRIHINMIRSYINMTKTHINMAQIPDRVFLNRMRVSTSVGTLIPMWLLFNYCRSSITFHSGTFKEYRHLVVHNA